jgi:hypothetical protein
MNRQPARKADESTAVLEALAAGAAMVLEASVAAVLVAAASGE